MTKDKKYTVIISERARQMLGTHIRFLAQVNKDEAISKKKELLKAIRSLSEMPQRCPFFNEPYISAQQISQNVCRQLVSDHLSDTGRKGFYRFYS